MPVKVQGIGAAEQIAGGIALANQVAGADLVVVTRGGGSLEDLWPFNEEVVARAIFGSGLPVVSAVGHEIDVTIADMVADFRALTPSEAGERVVPEARELVATLDRQGDRLARALGAVAARARLKVDRLSDRLARAGREHVRSARAELDDLDTRARLAMRADLDRRGHGLARMAAQLEALSPLKVLARGYSLTQDDAGAIVRDAASLRPATSSARGSRAAPSSAGWNRSPPSRPPCRLTKPRRRPPTAKAKARETACEADRGMSTIFTPGRCRDRLPTFLMIYGGPQGRWVRKR